MILGEGTPLHLGNIFAKKWYTSVVGRVVGEVHSLYFSDESLEKKCLG